MELNHPKRSFADPCLSTWLPGRIVFGFWPIPQSRQLAAPMNPVNEKVTSSA
jgi:hypothetical protein